MRILPAALLAANLLIGNLVSAGTEIVKPEKDQCQIAIASTSKAIQYFSDNSPKRAKQMRAWGELTAASPGSAVSEAMSFLNKVKKQQEKKQIIAQATLDFWQTEFQKHLRNLRIAEFRTQEALKEIDDVIQHDSAIIKKELQAASGEPDQSAQGVLAVRLSSLYQIKEQMRQNHEMVLKIYLQYRNEFDFYYPDFIEKASIPDPDKDVFFLSKINGGSKADQSYESFEVRKLDSKDVVVSHQSVSLAQKQRLSILSPEDRLQELVYDEAEWPNYQKALRAFFPMFKEIEPYLGQSFELQQFPSNLSPKSVFQFKSFDAQRGNLTLQDSTGAHYTVVKDHFLVQQLQIHLLMDVDNLIKKNKPVLVFTIRNTDYNPEIVTEVSLSNRVFRTADLYDESSDLRWQAVGALRGVPISFLPLSLNGFRKEYRPKSHIVIGSSWAIPMHPMYYKEFGPQLVAVEPYHDKMRFLRHNSDIKETGTSKLKSTETAGAVSDQPKDLEIGLSESKQKSFIDDINRLRVSLEGNGFYKDRTILLLNGLKRQIEEYNSNIDTLMNLLRSIDSHENPGMFSFLKDKKEQATHYQQALAALPGAVIQAKWQLAHHFNSEKEAVVLVQEILATLGRYQATLQSFQAKGSNNIYLQEEVKVFLSERVVLLTQIVRRIQSEQKRILKQKVDLENKVSKAETVINRLVDGGVIQDQFIGTHGSSSELIVPESLLTDKATEALKSFFELDASTLTKLYAPRPSDFQKSLEAAKLLANQKENNEIKEVEAPEVSNSDTESPLGFKNEQRRAFANEFSAFIESHGGLYSPPLQMWILSYEKSTDEFRVISKDGKISKKLFNEMPVFWEGFPPQTGARSENNYHREVVGRGLTFEGSEFYFYYDDEGHGRKGYSGAKFSEPADVFKYVQKGKIIPETSLVAQEEVLLIKDELKESLQSFIAETDRPSRRFFIDPERVVPYVHLGTPLAALEDNSILFTDRQYVHRRPEFTLNKESLKAMSVGKVLPLQSLAGEAVFEFFKKVTGRDEVFETRGMSYVRLPKKIHEGASLIFYSIKSGWELDARLQMYLILDEDIRDMQNE